MAKDSSSAGSAFSASATGAGAGSVQPSSQSTAVTSRKIRSTKTKHMPGVLSVKEYPVAEDRLDNIGAMRTSAAFWIAVGSLALGFALSCWQSLSLAGNDVPATSKVAWTVYRNVGFFIAVVAYGAGWYYFRRGNNAVKFIKEHTTHDVD